MLPQSLSVVNFTSFAKILVGFDFGKFIVSCCAFSLYNSSEQDARTTKFK